MSTKLRNTIRKIIKEEESKPVNEIDLLGNRPMIPFRTLQKELKEPMNHCDTASAQLKDISDNISESGDFSDELDDIRIDLDQLVRRIKFLMELK